MSLYERYELLDLNRDIGVKTFEAREIATGRPVRVHLFVQPSAPLQAALLKAIDKLPDDARQRILERGKHEGTPYVVTDRLADYPGLSEWVQAAGHAHKAAKPLLETAGAWKLPAAPPAETPPAPAPVPSAPAAVSPTASPLNAHSELNQKFTELFATAERPVVADSLLQASPVKPQNIAAPLRPPEPQPPAAVPPPQAKPEPGEFTRMFQSPVANPAIIPAAPSQPPAPQPPAQQTQAPPTQPAPLAPQAQAPPVSPAPLAAPAPTVKTPPPASKEAGEFTRMFQSPAGHGAMPVPAAPAPSATKSGPGEFTRFFQTPSPAGPMPQSPAVQQPLAPASGRPSFNPVSEFTRTFGKGTDAPAPPAAVAPQQEPGEFTRMFHSPVGAGSPAAPPPPSAPQAVPQPPPPPAGGAPRGFSIPTPVPAAPQPAGPGEYTRQFSVPAQLTFGQTSATPPAPLATHSPQAFAPPAMAQPAMPNMAPAPAPPRKTNLPLILGIVGIIIVAALLIVFFAMRPK
ncbi:MAG TPA: hypothetical protein VG273_24540 [Bryobacteraceae bacterium]|nr:hypothetical protein [Bryobacteraceae bacterium]